MARLVKCVQYMFTLGHLTNSGTIEGSGVVWCWYSIWSMFALLGRHSLPFPLAFTQLLVYSRMLPY